MVRTMIDILLKHRTELARAMRNHHYERSPGGVLFPKIGIFVGGVFAHTVNGRDRQVDPNIVPAEGIENILAIALYTLTKNTSFSIAPFAGNVDPGDGLTAATFDGTQTEFTNYSETTRVAWARSAPDSGTISNEDTPARFTISADTQTVYGAALIANATAKEATTGKLIACSKFGTARTGLMTGDKLDIEYALTAADAG